MKKGIVGAVLLACLIAGGVAGAQEKARFGYVDLRQVLHESKQGKKNSAELEKMVKERKDKLAKEQAKLKTMEDAFEKDKLVLTEQQKQKKQKEYQEKVQAYQKLAGEAQQEVQRKDREFADKAIAQVRAIVAEIAKEEKFTLVFEKNQMPVLYAEDGPDLTERVLKAYDAKSK